MEDVTGVEDVTKPAAADSSQRVTLQIITAYQAESELRQIQT